MSTPHDLGRTGEALAADMLQRAGWTILDRNFRVGRKEIDLVARRGDVVAFIEVKTRAGAGYGHPLEAITRAKRREIEHVARVWVARHADLRVSYRFDAIGVLIRGRGPPVAEHVADAWRL